MKIASLKKTNYMFQREKGVFKKGFEEKNEDAVSKKIK